MLFDEYKAALLTAIDQYQLKKDKIISKQRKKDCEDLINLIKNPKHTNALTLKSALETKLYKMKTGFWIFQTGHSELKKALHAILRAPQNQPEAISQAEVAAAEHYRQRLQLENEKLTAQTEVLKDKILEKKIQLKLQDLELEEEACYISYEAYCLNVLDKFISHQPLHSKEVELLAEFIQEETLNRFDAVFRKVISHKTAKACEVAFTTLHKGMDKLIDQDALMMQNFKATVLYADFYCQSIKAPAAVNSPYLERQLNKLLHSYCEDGAGKTVVSRLSVNDKSLVLENKEVLIVHHGSHEQKLNITPLCELRQDSRWDEFKTKCVEKSRYLFQWLREKTKTPRALSKENKTDLIEEIPAIKNVVRKLQFT